MAEVKAGVSCVEFYADEITCRELIGAVNVPSKSVFDCAAQFGKLICKTNKLNSVAVIYYNQDGSIASRDVIYR